MTPIDEYGFRKLPTAKIIGEPADTIDGANRGREIDYHVYGPSGIRYYKGPSSPPEEHGSLPMDVTVSAGDGTQVTRSYVASRNDDVLYAVDSRRGGEGLQVLAATRLPSADPANLGTDNSRIYAATDREVVVLETTDVYRLPAPDHSGDPCSQLPGGSSRGGPVGAAVRDGHRTAPGVSHFAGTPYVVSVAKPHL